MNPAKGTTTARAGTNWWGVALLLVFTGLLGARIWWDQRTAETNAKQAIGDMVSIPGGTFYMGDSGRHGYSNEQPVHPVTVPAFRMDKYEVTVGQFRRFVETTGYRTDAERNAGSELGCRILAGGMSDWLPGSSWRNPGFSIEADQPVVCVSWNDAQAFAAWLTRHTGEAFRLPTEAEWEYAARAGSATKYYFGDNESLLCQYGNHADTSTDFNWRNEDCSDRVGEQPAKVGSYQSNGYGLHDMHGNVWEWVQDCHNDSYRVSSDRSKWGRGASSMGGWVRESDHTDDTGVPDDGSAWLQGYCNWRVIRSGSWASQPRDLRSASRSWNARSYRFNALGFRLVQDKQGGDNE